MGLKIYNANIAEMHDLDANNKCALRFHLQATYATRSLGLQAHAVFASECLGATTVSHMF